VLSRKTKYAIKALMVLARNKANKPMRIGEIAGPEALPQRFPATILLDLKRCGVIGTRQGSSGGYYLIKKPEDIKVIALMRIIDGPIALTPCVSLNFYERCDECIDEEGCGIRKLMMNVRDASLSILTTASIADLVATEVDLKNVKKPI
jgi:Rrf2 family protein